MFLNSPTPRYRAPRWASAEWRLLLLWRLGTSLGLPIACVACGACQDAFGDHALSCSAMGMYTRHNTLRDAMVDLASSVGLQCRTSVGLPGTNLVPADLFLPSSDVPTAVHVSVVHSSKQQFLPHVTFDPRKMTCLLHSYDPTCRGVSIAILARELLVFSNTPTGYFATRNARTADGQTTGKRTLADDQTKIEQDTRQ